VQSADSYNVCEWASIAWNAAARRQHAALRAAVAAQLS
jgi:hypothetical protein